MASASFLDSEATFAQQAGDAGLSEAWVDALRTRALAIFAKMSFAVTSPGVVAKGDQITRFLGDLWHRRLLIVQHSKGSFSRVRH